jgi:hypothetical protein
MKRAALAGRWQGGPHNTVIEIRVVAGSEVQGSYRCPKGGRGEFSGRVHRHTMMRGFWVDPEVDGAAARSEKQTLDIRLDGSGDAWNATAVTAEGVSLAWTATRVKASVRGAGEPLSAQAWCKNKEVFERLTRPKQVDKWVSEVRTGRARGDCPYRMRCRRGFAHLSATPRVSVRCASPASHRVRSKHTSIVTRRSGPRPCAAALLCPRAPTCRVAAAPVRCVQRQRDARRV